MDLELPDELAAWTASRARLMRTDVPGGGFYILGESMESERFGLGLTPT